MVTNGTETERGRRTPKRYVTLGMAAILVLATVGVYSRTLSNDFVNYDDNQYVTSNRNIKDGLSWDVVKWAFGDSYYASNWHPLTWLSHALDVELFDMRPGGHHAVSVAFHVLNTLLLFWLLLYTTGRMWASWFVAALFALHPLHVESVAWVSERKDVLSTFFWLWTMLAYAYYAKQPGLWRYLLILPPFALGLMSKPMLVTVPAVLLLVDYWPLERFRIEWKKRKLKYSGTRFWQILLEKIPLLLMVAGSATITLMAQRKAMSPWEIMDLLTRITNAIVSYGRYLRETVWPAGLAAFYPHGHEPLYPAAVATLIFIVAVTAAVVYASGRGRYLVFGWFWYLVTLIPVIGLVQVGDQSHADRYTYVPLIGIFVMIVWAVAGAVERRKDLARLAVAIGVLILIGLSVLTWRQTGFWRNDLALFKRCTDVTEGNYVMLSNLGVTYSRMKELDRAIDAFQQSLSIRPYEGRTLNGLGSVFMEKQQYGKALEYLHKAVEYEPDLKEAQLSAAKALIKLRRFAEAEPYCRKAIGLDPYWAEPHAQLANVLTETGRLEEAVMECQIAMKLEPRLAMAHFNLAGVYVKREDFAAAAEEYKRAIAIEPDYSAWNNLGNSQLRLGRLEEALNSYTESIRLEPRQPSAYFNKGIALAQLGRRTEAIEAVRQALALSPDSRDVKEYLDALYREQARDTAP